MNILHGIAALLIVLADASSALACSERDSPTDTERFERAHEVFVARIVSSELRLMPAAKCDAAHCEYVSAKYELVEPLKGSPRRRGTVLADFPDMCGPSVLVGWYHLLYVGDDHSVEKALLIDVELEEDERVELRKMRAYPHAQPSSIDNEKNQRDRNLDQAAQ
jgi:hypothetical protein